jgi:hypothetical protein
MEKIYEALKSLLPESDIQEVATAVNEMIAEARRELEKEFNAQLETAYEQLTAELSVAEATAEQGYQQAFQIINELQNRLEAQAEEYEDSLEKGYSEAWEMIQAEQAKNQDLEVSIYNEFDEKFKQIRELMIDKLSNFMEVRTAEIYDAARREIMNDPRQVEHKVALDKIVDITSSYLSDENKGLATSSKLEEAQKAVEDLRGQMRVLEARNIRLNTQNTKLNEEVRSVKQMMNENTKVERKERARTAGNVSGRGSKVVGEQIIAEYSNPAANKTNNDDSTLLENNAAMDDLLVLSGLKERD